jgi:hypothetical protein
MRLIDQYYAAEPVDTYTLVFDEVSPETGQYTMLPMRPDTFAYSQFGSVDILEPRGSESARRTR